MFLKSASPYAKPGMALRMAIDRVNLLFQQSHLASVYGFLLRGMDDKALQTQLLEGSIATIPASAEKLKEVEHALADGVHVTTTTPEEYNGNVLHNSTSESPDLFTEGDEYMMGWYPKASTWSPRSIFINSLYLDAQSSIDQTSRLTALLICTLIHVIAHLVTDVFDKALPMRWIPDDEPSLVRKSRDVLELALFGGIRLKGIRLADSYKVGAIVARVYPGGHEVALMDSEIAAILEGSFPWNNKFEAVKIRLASPVSASRLAIRQCGVFQKSQSTRPLGGGKPAVTIPDTRDVRDRFFDENTLRRLTDARQKRIAAKQQGTTGEGDSSAPGCTSYSTARRVIYNYQFPRAAFAG